MRVETINGRHLLCGGILNPSYVRAGQIWAPASGANSTVTVESATEDWVDYSWVDNGEKKTHSKMNFAFQCRYCLVLEDGKIPEELVNHYD